MAVEDLTRREVELFWSRVEKTDGCWLWTETCWSFGYAQVYISKSRRQTYGHRIAYELLVGPIPEGMYLHHTCEVRRCVNPKHLVPMLPSDHIKLHKPKVPRRTHCRKGLHEMTGPNLITDRKGYRGCRACKKESARLRWLRKKAAPITHRATD